ncbi:YaaA family protein [Arthrobacter crystallopoietes]|uniref:YaaA family protein n=1 Tax=Crystallibacter crystallopoietes TaxID=37928 RepID=UPI0011114619|nr:peroxide stress protein YaaA [Arthrobacter crystallopoietes]
MLILLPPSEGKTAAAKGHPFELSELHFPELNPAREEVLNALAHVSSQPDALVSLGVGASLAAEVERNTRLHNEPSAAAHTVYSGVLYDALGYRTMTPAQKRKADAAVVIVSALWGAIAFPDFIPAYRLSMSVGLPETGKLASYWKKHLPAALDAHADGHLLVDCRSSSYAAAWSPAADRTVVVNVFQERNGKRTVVSHFAKHTRGELARHLLTRRGKAPETPGSLLKAAQEKWQAELAAGTARKPHALNIILPELAG